jgi:hypothetical protein
MFQYDPAEDEAEGKNAEDGRENKSTYVRRVLDTFYTE